jgi:hypothetical protein
VVTKSGTEGDEGTSGDGGFHGTPVEVEEPPGLIDLYAEAMSRAESFTAHLQAAITALNTMQTEVAVDPLHPGASAGRRLVCFKRLTKQMTPYAERFERSAEQAEEAARLLNKTMFNGSTTGSDQTCPSLRLLHHNAFG